MNNYCSNCGYALPENAHKCPECNQQVLRNHVLHRKLSISKSTKWNFIFSIFIALTLINIMGAAAGMNFSVYIGNYYVDEYQYVDPTTFVIGWGALFLMFPLSIFVFVRNRKDFLMNQATDNEWLMTIFLFIVSFLSWIPYIVVWFWGNW